MPLTHQIYVIMTTGALVGDMQTCALAAVESLPLVITRLISIQTWTPVSHAILHRSHSSLFQRMTQTVLLQVRCYFGDNEQRWFMWFSGNNTGGRAIDAVSPSSGSTGVPVAPCVAQLAATHHIQTHSCCSLLVHLTMQLCHWMRTVFDAYTVARTQLIVA